jgi:histidyl-tRNA synthetase
MSKSKGEVIIYKPILQNSYSYKGPLNKVIDTARHYGFNLIEPISVSKKIPSSIVKNNLIKTRDLSDFPKDYMSTLKKYMDDEMHKFSQPIMFCHIVNKPKNLTELRLEIVGTRKSVAEATVIKTASVILEELGYKNLSIRLNSVGDKESGNVFMRELTNYYRDHVENFPPIIREQTKKDILRVFTNRGDKYREINENAPKPIGFLSEESRTHLSQIIDFVEGFGINYEIDHSLIGCTSCLPKTVYEIVETGEGGEVLASGERHNYLAQIVGLNKKIPIVGMRIKLTRKGSVKDSYHPARIQSQPKIYFIHLGFEAKKKSLSVLEVFRKSKVPIHQSLHEDSFADQIRIAQSIKVPYTMIMGHKEALENSIIFRDMETRYQESIELSKLEDFLLNLRNKRLV